MNDLAKSPNIVVLDRQEMKSLEDENKLTGNDRRFQTSALFLDGEISLNFDGKLIVDVNLKSKDGTIFKSFKATGTRTILRFSGSSWWSLPARS